MKTGLRRLRQTSLPHWCGLIVIWTSQSLTIQLGLTASCDPTGAAPEAALKALQGPLQKALQQAQDEDRPQTFAAAEALSGLISSPASFQSPSGMVLCIIRMPD